MNINIGKWILGKSTTNNLIPMCILELSLAKLLFPVKNIKLVDVCDLVERVLIRMAQIFVKVELDKKQVNQWTP